MRESDFAFAVGRVRVLETRLLDTGKFERMLEARDVDEVLRILAETEYAQSVGSMKNASDYESALNNERRSAFTLIKSLLAAGQDIGELYFLRFDVHNLKVICKAGMVHQSPEGLSDQGIYGPELLRRFVDGDEKAPFPISGWLEKAREVMTSGNPGLVDAALDGAYFAYAASQAREKNWPAISRYWIATIDLTNFLSAIRCRRLGSGMERFSTVYLQGGEYNPSEFAGLFEQSDDELARWLNTHGFGEILGSSQKAFADPGSLERGITEYLFSIVDKAGRSTIVGPEAVFAFLLAKERELQMVRIIVVGKLNGVPGDVLRERLDHAHL